MHSSVVDNNVIMTISKLYTEYLSIQEWISCDAITHLPSSVAMHPISRVTTHERLVLICDSTMVRASLPAKLRPFVDRLTLSKPTLGYPFLNARFLSPSRIQQLHKPVCKYLPHRIVRKCPPI